MVVEPNIIGSGNSFAPGRRRQTIIRTKARILLIGPLGTTLEYCLLDPQEQIQ